MKRRKINMPTIIAAFGWVKDDETVELDPEGFFRAYYTGSLDYHMYNMVKEMIIDGICRPCDINPDVDGSLVKIYALPRRVLSSTTMTHKYSCMMEFNYNGKRAVGLILHNTKRSAKDDDTAKVTKILNKISGLPDRVKFGVNINEEKW